MRRATDARKNGLILLLIATLVFLPTLPVFSQQTDAELGAAQGNADAQGNGWWFLAGFALPGVGLILPWLFSPSVPADNLIGKSDEYVAAYQKAFKDKKTLGNFFWALGGFGTAVIVCGVAVAVVAVNVATSVGNACGNSASNACAPSLSCSGL